MAETTKAPVKIDVNEVGTGTFKVGDVDLANVASRIQVTIDPNDRGTQVILFMRHSALAAALANADVRVDMTTAAALTELGWTPPGIVGVVEEVELQEDALVLSWHPLDDDGDPVEIPLGEPWLLPGTDVKVGEFRLSTREVPVADEPMLCDGCDSTDKPVEATDDGRALACPDCLPGANAAIAEATREVSGG